MHNETTEKYAIEIDTPAGWVIYHYIMRPGKERAMDILKELQEKYPNANFRVVRLIGKPI